jgi:HSP20 family protein
MSPEHPSIRVAVHRSAPEGSAHPHAGPVPEPVHEAELYQTPLIDIHEGADGLILEADLPGATDNGVSIQLEDNILSLHARVPSPAPDGARILHEEYRVGDYYRSFILSDEVERSRISAELKNGVLRLTLPKAERAKTRRIEIKS